MPKKEEAPPARSFEDAMRDLDAIVARLEEDQLPLEDMLARYEEGVALARLCTEKLNAAEQRVRLIARKADGSVELQEFDEKPED